MANSVVVKLVCLAIGCLVLGVSSPNKAQAAVTCNQGVSNLTPCISCVLIGGKTVLARAATGSGPSLTWLTPHQTGKPFATA
ncbi:hypothetical protein E2542_SST08543 [Spatholobus suberectus]|nr:hypothetical protein E2542_SST08543 [Spatholobus suberectus]